MCVWMGTSAVMRAGTHNTHTRTGKHAQAHTGTHTYTYTHVHVHVHTPEQHSQFSGGPPQPSSLLEERASSPGFSAGTYLRAHACACLCVCAPV